MSFLSAGIADGIATVAFTRPDKGNAYESTMLRGLFDALVRAADDPAIRAFVLRGEGRHFCAGVDVGASESGGPTIAETCWRLDTLPKPTVAVVQGACIGGGMALVACCDVVIAERDAFFAMPEVRLGFAAGPIIPFVLRAIGYRQARRLLVTGERFSAEDALRLGLVHVLCDSGQGETTLRAALGELLQAAPAAAAATKAMARKFAGEPITPAMLDEMQEAFRTAIRSDEAQEGRTAFREKRLPRWKPDGF